MLRPYAVLAASALTLSLMGSAPTWAAWPFDTEGQNQPSLAPMLKKAMPAVVNISTKTKIRVEENPLLRDPFFRHFFEIPNAPRERETSSLGSGVIVDASHGYILTNNHVIDKADEILVTLHDGQRLPAKVVGLDPDSDVAVIKVESKSLAEIPIADSSQLQVGDFVVAIGNPFGLGQTVTSGIVSALGRSGLGIEGYEDFIQTDASINPGNSGGALVNLKGELVGINTAILAPTGGNVGIGFAIPSNMAASIMETLIKHGSIRRGMLGVNIQDLTPDLSQAFGLSQTQGAVITAVQPDSPAAKAGLEPGDIVVSINDRKIKNAMEVRNAIGLLQIDDKVKIEYVRKGVTETTTARIAAPKIVQEDGRKIHPRLAGTLLGNTPPNSPVEGVRVEKIQAQSYAFRAGLRPGDILTQANRQPIKSISELRAAVQGRDELLLGIQRGDNAFFLILR